MGLRYNMTFQISQNNNRIDLAFSATLSNVDRAADMTKSFLITAGLEKQVFGVLLGLREALNNAVLKGCKRSPFFTISNTNATA